MSHRIRALVLFLFMSHSGWTHSCEHSDWASFWKAGFEREIARDFPNVSAETLSVALRLEQELRRESTCQSNAATLARETREVLQAASSSLLTVPPQRNLIEAFFTILATARALERIYRPQHPLLNESLYWVALDQVRTLIEAELIEFSFSDRYSETHWTFEPFNSEWRVALGRDSPAASFVQEGRLALNPTIVDLQTLELLMVHEWAHFAYNDPNESCSAQISEEATAWLETLRFSVFHSRKNGLREPPWIEGIRAQMRLTSPRAWARSIFMSRDDSRCRNEFHPNQ